MGERNATPAGTLESPADVKRKQLFLITAIVIVVMLATFFTTIFSSSGSEPKSAKKEPVRKSTIAVPSGTVDPRELWVGAAGDQIATLEREKRALDQRIQRLEEKDKARDLQPAAAPESPMPPLGPPPVTNASPPPQEDQQPSAPRTPLPPPAAELSGAAPAVPAINRITTTEVMKRTVAAPPSDQVQAAQPAKTSSVDPIASQPVSGSAGADKDLTRDDYVPAGSFFRAVMLSGLDAPTGGQVQANPHPVLLRLLDNAILPNRFRAQVKECFVVAAGYGDMSSERAYLRTESLSCVNRSGQVIDVPIHGWAIGDDGKAGIRGRVVSKQGQAIANAMLSGVLAGLGSAIKESSVETHVGGITGTVVQTPKPGREFRAGVGEGVSKGLDRLTEYYIKLAERIFPVIEVDAGRVVDIALNKGMSLKGLYRAEPTGSSRVGDHAALSNRHPVNRGMPKQVQE